MKKLYIIIAIILLIPIWNAGVGFAQNVTIPDANFKAALVGNSSINTNLDTEIQVTEAVAVTGTLNLSVGLFIADLTGIEAFTALTGLNCNNNLLTSLNVSANTSLTTLGCNSNQLTSLNVSANTALTILDCQINLLTILDVSANTALTQLYCRNNQLTSLDVSANSVLDTLTCRNNQLSSLNVKNGNNFNMPGSGFYAQNNPSLSCIQVDNVAYSIANWTNIDVSASYSTNCVSFSISEEPDDNKFNVYPNPFLGNTTIAYSIGSDANVKLDVYNVLGVKVQSLVNTQQESGDYQYNFNPQSNNLKSGVYFISLSVNGKTSTMRIVEME